MCVKARDTEHRKHQGEKQEMQRGETAVASIRANWRTSTSSWCRWGREWTHTRGLRLRDSGDTRVSVRGGPSARASRQQRGAFLTQQARRRSSHVGVGVSREEGRRCRPGVRGPGEDRSERGKERWQERAVRGGLA
ncbi:unnamed protein product [Ectocarpus sp. 12 AP-2014]